jgi:GNAT superfamily N-acetyltransferase
MQLEIVHDKEEIEAFLRRDVPLHIYELGDLDDFYWPHTTWYAMRERGEVKTLIMVYTAEPLPVVLSFCEREEVSLQGELMRAIVHLLPKHFYGHFTPGIEKAIRHGYMLTPMGAHHRMSLKDEAQLVRAGTSSVFPLSIGDLGSLMGFYELSYPGHNFSPIMLKPGMYWGIKHDDTIVSAAGVHVYSRSYGVAALGNIATHPDFRRRGLGTSVTMKLCLSLLDEVKSIGLNVRTDNAAAIHMYKNVGFSIEAECNHYTAERK